MKPSLLPLFRILVILSLTALNGAAQIPAPPAAPADSRTWLAYAEKMASAAATGGGGYSYSLHKGGGTSVYLKVDHGGATIGAILPENSATSIEGETASYHIARVLGFPELSQPAALLILRGNALESFRTQLRASSFRGQKEENRKAVLSRISSNPGGIPVVFKQWLPLKPVAIDSLVNPSLSPNGRLRPGTKLAGFLLRSGPMPGSARMTLPESKSSAPETDLARQLSNILLVDALTGQWDRFSGGNLQAYAIGGNLRLVALDNGGSSLASKDAHLTRFYQSVTRFDPGTVAKLSAFCDFLHGRTRSLDGFNAPAALLSSLGISPGNHARFIARTQKVTDHVRNCSGATGGVFR